MLNLAKMSDFIGHIIAGYIVGGIGAVVRYLIYLPFSSRLTFRQCWSADHLSEDEQFFHRSGNFGLGLIVIAILVIIFI